MIALTVALNFREPIIYSAFRLSDSFLAIVPMPETSMYKNCKFASNPCQIRFAGNVFPVDTVASETQRPHEFSDNKFWLRILAANTAHIFRSA